MTVETEPLRGVLEKELLELEVTFTARGHKSSEGDGRTAEDIRRELEEQD